MMGRMPLYTWWEKNEGNEWLQPYLQSFMEAILMEDKAVVWVRAIVDYWLEVFHRMPDVERMAMRIDQGVSESMKQFDLLQGVWCVVLEWKLLMDDSDADPANLYSRALLMQVSRATPVLKMAFGVSADRTPYIRLYSGGNGYGNWQEVSI